MIYQDLIMQGVINFKLFKIQGPFTYLLRFRKTSGIDIL